jgi:hypothetical protein
VTKSQREAAEAELKQVMVAHLVDVHDREVNVGKESVRTLKMLHGYVHRQRAGRSAG